MARITGIGGVLFKSRGDHAQLAAWYARHLGLTLEAWGGAVLRWSADAAPDGGVTVWHVAEAASDGFSPSDAGFMINYRVDDLEGLLAELRRDGIPVLKGPETHENGLFAWLLDPEGNKVELWEPRVAINDGNS